MSHKSLSRAGGSSLLVIAALLASVGAPAPLSAQDVETPAPTQADAAAEDAAGGIPAWGITDAQLPADPSVVYGVLDNGMRYALKRNTQPAGEASMRLLFEVGSRDEADGEEGAAHFVEHMAFNGSTNIPEGELVPMLERLGLAFGADTNAETAPHYTMYKLDLPNLDQETVETALSILRETASELTIAPDAVEREKGIVVSEYQVRNSPQQRRAVQFLNEVMATSRLADRAVAEPDAIRALSADTLRGFYEGFYRPDRSTLVIVGDFEPAEMERRISERFASWQASGEARENFDARIADIDGIKVTTFVDPASPELIELERVVPYRPAENSVEEYRGGLMDQIASNAIGNRLGVLARAEDAKTLGGQLLVQDLFKSAKAYGIITIAKDGEWPTSLEVAEQEWRRAAQFGFTNAEVEQAKAAIDASLATAAAQSNSQRSASISTALAISSLDNKVRLSPEQQLALYRQLSGTITPEAVQANFVAKWGESPTYVSLASKTETEGASEAIAAAFRQSTQVALTAPEEVVDAPFAYTDFGGPGEVVSDRRIEDLGIRAIAFANGVQLNLKRTDFEPGNVRVQVEVGTGLSTVEGLPGLGVLATVVAGADDLGAHKADELSRILAGKQVGYGYSLGQEAIVLSASPRPEDLLLQLQLMTGQITDTAFSAQAQRQWEGVAPILATNIRASAQQMFGTSFQAVLTGGDDRFGMLDPNALAQRSMSDLKNVVGSQFARGRIEIGIVGDFEEADVIEMVASTLGALDRPETVATEIAPPEFIESRDVQTVYHAGEADQGMIALSWPTDDGQDLRSELTRRLVAELIGLRAIEVLREELAATYTPNAISSASSVYDDYGFIGLIAPATPDSMADASRVVRELVAELVAAAPSEDAVQRARQPILERYERSEGSNAGWIGLVVDTQSNPERLDDRRNRADVLASITADEIQAAARRYLTAEPIEIRVVPSPAEASE